MELPRSVLKITFISAGKVADRGYGEVCHAGQMWAWESWARRGALKECASASRRHFRRVSIRLLSFWESAFQIGGTEGPWLVDQLPCCIHLTPDVP